MPSSPFLVHRIGRIHKKEGQVWVEVDAPYREAMLGLSEFSHIYVFYWLHENDTPQQRATLQVHPRKNPRNQLTGVFATHAPVRPNLIAMTHCRVISVTEARIYLHAIDARDGSPLIDIKCYIPHDIDQLPVRVPSWVHQNNDAIPGG
jgi:tRNA-Thr(GGU) m(6)t(6)A37 methyltransferase TsaA